MTRLKELSFEYKYIIVGYYDGACTDTDGETVSNEQVLDYCKDEEEAIESILKLEEEGWQDVTPLKITAKLDRI